MKKIILLFFVAVVAGASIWAFLKIRNHRLPEAEGEKQPAEVSRVQRSTNGETIITLDAETQKRIGLQVAALMVTNVSREIKGYGRVLDPAPLAALTAELVSAQFAAIASVQEFERLKTLNDQNNASTRALQAAEATALRDQLLVQTTRDKIILSWGKAVAGQADMAAFVRALTSLESFMARVELPAGESLKSPPTGARLVSLAAGDQSVEAELLGPAPVVDSQTQGQSFLFLVRENSLSLAPGAALTGYLELPGQPLNGVIVPRVAVLRHNGQAWVYVQTAADKFTRREIHLHHSVEAGWLVTTGLSATDRIVTIGAQTLLSEELNSSGPSSSAKD